jgi:hypothetical protein
MNNSLGQNSHPHHPHHLTHPHLQHHHQLSSASQDSTAFKPVLKSSSGGGFCVWRGVH